VKPSSWAMGISGFSPSIIFLIRPSISDIVESPPVEDDIVKNLNP
jgi:hypothetical protein